MYPSITLGHNAEKHLQPVEGASQSKPRRSYVYAHVTSDGKYFYIGKGAGDRAWSFNDRHPLWYRYVKTRLGGKFAVIILQDTFPLTKRKRSKVNGSPRRVKPSLIG